MRNKRKNIDFLVDFFENKIKITRHYYYEGGLELGYEAGSGRKFVLSSENGKVLFVSKRSAEIKKVSNILIKELSNKGKLFLLEWYPLATTHSEVKSIEELAEFSKRIIRSINLFLSSYEDSKVFINFFSEIITELYNLNYFESNVLKRILISTLNKSKKKELYIKEFIENLKNTIFKTAFENETRISILKKLDEIIEDRYLQEISIKFEKEYVSNEDLIINLEILNNVKTKLFLLSLLLHHLSYLINLNKIYNIILILPSVTFYYIKQLNRLEIIESLDKVLKCNATFVLLCDDLQNIPMEIRNQFDFILLTKEYLDANLEKLKNYFNEKIIEKLRQKIESFENEEIVALNFRGDIFSFVLEEKDWLFIDF